MLPAHRPPTHILTVEVPLALDQPPHDFHPAKDAIETALAISRAAFTGHICGDPTVTLSETGILET